MRLRFGACSSAAVLRSDSANAGVGNALGGVDFRDALGDRFAPGQGVADLAEDAGEEGVALVDHVGRELGHLGGQLGERARLGEQVRALGTQDPVQHRRVTAAVGRDDLEEEVVPVARRPLRRAPRCRRYRRSIRTSPLATRAAKEAVNRSYETTLREGLLFERRLFDALFATEDQAEGMAAFIEKRAPGFKGR